MSAVTEEEGRNESLSGPALVLILTNSKANLATRKSKVSRKTMACLLLPFQFITLALNLCGNHIKGLIKEMH